MTPRFKRPAAPAVDRACPEAPSTPLALAAAVSARISAVAPVPAEGPAGRPAPRGYDTGEERFLRAREVADLVALSESQVYALVQQGTFPAPLVLGPRYSRWLASEVRTWMRTRIAQAPRTRRVS